MSRLTKLGATGATFVGMRLYQTRKAFRERWWPQFCKAFQSAPRWLVLLFLAVCFWSAVIGLWGVPAGLAAVLALIAIFGTIGWWPRFRKSWQSAQRWLSKNYVPIVFFLAVAVCVWGLWIELWRVPGEVSGLLDALKKSTGNSDKTRSIITALAAVLAVIAIFGTIIVQSISVWTRERQTKTIEEGHVTDRLTKAIEQLGAEKSVKRILAKNLDGEELGGEKGAPLVVETTEPNLEVRLGAIYALERIAQDSERDHGTIMEILCAYVRENAKAQDTPASPIDELPEGSDDADRHDRQVRISEWLESLPNPRVDVQAALTVVGRRADHRIAAEKIPLDLRRTNQRKAHLAQARLEGALLSEARMEGANLREARLERAMLMWTQLEGANLAEARLEGAYLFRAELEGAYLGGARMEKANLAEARLEGASLREARLEGANLSEARLEGTNLDLARLEGANLAKARLDGASLTQARLKGANLSQARLERANLTEAGLEGANLTGARLAGANLTRARLEGAILDGADFGNQPPPTSDPGERAPGG